MIKINEIFYSIQGESTLTGLPTIFIRSSGCHLRCNYCDTKYAYNEGERLNCEEILKKISIYPCKRICITGGEPLLQKNIIPLMETVLTKGYECSIETSGDLDCSPIPSGVLKVIDVKTPDSGEGEAFCLKNLHFVGDKASEFKFVICSEADFDWAVHFAAKHHMFQNTKILFSPCHEQISAEWLAKKILDSGQKIRLQIQLHKVLWPTTTKGI